MNFNFRCVVFFLLLLLLFYRVDAVPAHCAVQYLGFPVASAGALRMLLHQRLKRSQRLLQLTLTWQRTMNKLINDDYRRARASCYLKLSASWKNEQWVRRVCTFLRSFSAASTSALMVLSNLFNSFGFFFFAVGERRRDEHQRNQMQEAVWRS